jgi:hypothetical protein
MEFQNPNIEVLTINPSWIPGALIMEKKLVKQGFIYDQTRPDGAIVLKAVLKEIK